MQLCRFGISFESGNFEIRGKVAVGLRRYSILELRVAIFKLTSDNLFSMCPIVYAFVVESILQELSSPALILIVYGLFILLDVCFTYYTDVLTTTTKSRPSRLQFTEGAWRKAQSSLLAPRSRLEVFFCIKDRSEFERKL